MGNEIKVGDRVAAYSGGDRYVGAISRVAANRAIEIIVDTPKGFTVFAHAKQLRRLKPKRKAREWVLSQYQTRDGIWRDKAGGPSLKNGESVLVREVLPKRAKA